MSMVSAIYRKGGKADRYRADSWYPTRDPDAIAALMIAEQPFMPDGAVYDGACGEGDILKIVKGFGRRVIGTDLVDRGYGRGGIDFLSLDKLPADILIMNPPYDDGLDEKFLLHALHLQPLYVAMLLKAPFFFCQSRLKVTDICAPARIYPLSWRIDFTGQGKPHSPSGWCVFTPRTPTRANDTRFMRALTRPKPRGIVYEDRI